MSKLVLDREGSGGGGPLNFHDSTVILAGPYGTELERILGKDWKERVASGNINDEQVARTTAQIAEAYVANGAGILLANTFGARSILLERESVGREGRFFAEVNRQIAMIWEFIIANRQRIAHVGLSLGPCGDCYQPDQGPGSIAEAQDFHEFQALATNLVPVSNPRAWFETFNNKTDALGAVLAAKRLDVTATVSFVLGTDGNLLSSESLEATIREIDSKTGNYAKAFGLNCCTLEAAEKALASIRDPKILARIQIIYPNAAKEESYSNLENSDQIIGLAGEQAIAEYRRLIALQRKYPNLKVVGGCCGYNPQNIKDLRVLVGGATRQVTAF